MKALLIFSLFLLAQMSLAQQPVTVYKDAHDTLQNYYIIRVPKDTIKGLLVLNARFLSDSSNQRAYEMGICVLTVVPTADYMDNLTSSRILNRIDSMISEVVSKQKISNSKIIIGGMSVAGTGSVRYAEYCYSNKSKYGIKPCGVFAVDPPLDYERLFNESTKAVSRNFNSDAVEESKMLIKILSNSLKGTPQTNIKSYQAYSPFCYSAKNGGNAHLLNHLAIRLYTEPDINWWIENRRKDYYDLNCIDNAALIDQLKLNGNLKAELIVADGKGLKISGHPHSWSIVDEQELLLWCSDLFSQ